MLRKTVAEINELDYEEKLGWFEYFQRRPYGWRDDNRAFIIATSMGGGKVKPEDLFDSLKIIKEQNTSKASVGEKFFEKFSNKMTETTNLEKLQ